MNQMTITALLWGNQGEYMVPIHSSDDQSPADDERIIDRKRPSLSPKYGSNAMKDLLLGACLCNNATQQSSSNAPDGTENPAMEMADDKATTEITKLVGDAADVALYRLCQDKCSVDIELVRKVNPRINVVPFNSKNKFMITANLLERNAANNDENVLIILKGAPDFVLPRCSTFKADQGDAEMSMTDEFKQSVQQRQEALGKSGYRVIAMLQQTISKNRHDANMEAYKKSKKQNQPTSDEPDLNGLPTNNYCFIGEYSFYVLKLHDMLYNRYVLSSRSGPS
jgi:magnesium-transporting ATPase (P-type)